jgi:hypothetical protein
LIVPSGCGILNAFTSVPLTSACDTAVNPAELVRSWLSS